MLKIKLNKSSTAVLALQVGQKLEEPMLTQSVCILDGIREKVFEHSEVAAKNERPLKKRRVKRNHVEVKWEEKNVKNPFIIREQVAGHPVRIQIDSGWT
jgi:hypothetical protein